MYRVSVPPRVFDDLSQDLPRGSDVMRIGEVEKMGIWQDREAVAKDNTTLCREILQTGAGGNESQGRGGGRINEVAREIQGR